MNSNVKVKEIKNQAKEIKEKNSNMTEIFHFRFRFFPRCEWTLGVRSNDVCSIIKH